MPKEMGVADFKKHFSSVINQVSLNGEHFIIKKKGRPMAAVVSLKELDMIERSEHKRKRKGLLAAIGAWEDFDGLEKTITAIYDKRRKSKDRPIGRLG